MQNISPFTVIFRINYGGITKYKKIAHGAVLFIAGAVYTAFGIINVGYSGDGYTGKQSLSLVRQLKGHIDEDTAPGGQIALPLKVFYHSMNNKLSKRNGCI